MERLKMSKSEKNWSRRDFLKATGAAGVGSVLASISPLAKAAAKSHAETFDVPLVPKRPFGQTGVNVSMLGLGGSGYVTSSELFLRQAIKMGVTYWDTAETYGRGKSEEGIAKHFTKHPEDRKKVFLVTKSQSRDVDGLSLSLDQSLKRMKTSFVDLYFIHMLRGIQELRPFREFRRWVEKRKSEGKIRFFGFSTHSFMESSMMEAAELGWIDGIMMSYNYRLMHTDKMKKAVDACVKAGIGLTAMKTQAVPAYGFVGDMGMESETALKLTERFLKKGFTLEQAKLKAVWQNGHIASICSEMDNMTILMANVAAALDRTKLSSRDMKLLQEYAHETASSYCAGCANVCEAAVEGDIPISDVMRYLMYSRSYGDRDRAKSLYRQISQETRRRLASAHYSEAERRCPQGMPIGRLMREAADELA
jgi:predicted aldo/keto reductase-like oxidoreductase